MSVIIRLTIFLLLIVAAIIFIYFGSIWREATTILNKAEREIAISVSQSHPMNKAEQLIAFSEFEQTWNLKGYPCPSLIMAWESVIDSDKIQRGAHVSYFVVREITKQTQPERTIRSLIRDLFTACQLEQNFDNATLLRHWLKNAYFGNGEFGITVAADSIFGKPVDELTFAESAKLAALLRIPHLRSTPPEWEKRSKYISERFTSSRPQVET